MSTFTNFNNLINSDIGQQIKETISITKVQLSYHDLEFHIDGDYIAIAGDEYIHNHSSPVRVWESSYFEGMSESEVAYMISDQIWDEWLKIVDRYE